MTDTPTFKDFLYGRDGYYNNLVSPVDPQTQALLKATTPLTYSTSTTWFDPVYLGRLELEGLTRSKSAFSALRKTSYQQEGDSYQIITTDSHEGLGNILESGALFAAYTNPAVVDVDSIYPAVLKYDWVNTEVAAALSGIQRSRSMPTLDQIKDYVSTKFLDAIEQQICGVYVNAAAVHGVDSPASAASVAQFECIDRMITNAAEANTNWCSAATDPDLFWNSTGDGTERTDIGDRSGGEGVANCRLPNVAAGGSYVAGEAYNILDELDDLMAKCLVYAKEPYNYVAFMSPKSYNKIKAEEDPKAIIADYPSARLTVNGLSTTQGGTGGKPQFSALRLSDVTVPVVCAPYLMGTAASSWLWKTTIHTTGGCGNIYLVNMDCMEFRTLIPITYRSVPMESGLQTKHTLYMAGQLIAKNWLSHGALKYIAT